MPDGNPNQGGLAGGVPTRGGNPPAPELSGEGGLAGGAPARGGNPPAPEGGLAGGAPTRGGNPPAPAALAEGGTPQEPVPQLGPAPAAPAGETAPPAGPGLEKAAAQSGAPEGVPPCPGGQPVQVQPGDTLFLLAQRYGVPLAAVILANPQIVDPDRIVPGQWICIPSAPPGCPGGRLVVVQPGDSLFTIGQRNGVPVEAMIAANPQLADPNQIQPGQVVCVPRAPVGCTGILYVVQPGDTLFQVAQRFGVELQDLVAANPQITNPDRIWPGEVVCVPAGG
ncbi:LysM peptidoglycan-binding domain-containing protein [Thermaerobacter sp. PB12/4term]|uniref:LysM peptidoglycan-binding domain-containing protein n=1 Tax=Thermaerobacter sp. PB12/4term TaxID=2293838 RepID=UPI000E327B43|nr:LysM peptidoglycan-binding domain-containing protein [Thermaerobacter sp. PB12/4term]QIA26606.1 LysM peptidoglycan-binding domain-containing protein [Thermaerobacter sp. PB12/4term]